MNKTEILNSICYTELVYGRINKKLKTNHSIAKLEKLIFALIQATPDKNFRRIGKNIYVSNMDKNVRVTINSNTFRVITVDLIER